MAMRVSPPCTVHRPPHSRPPQGATCARHAQAPSACPQGTDLALVLEAELADDLMAVFAEHYPNLAEFTADHVMQPGYSFADVRAYPTVPYINNDCANCVGTALSIHGSATVPYELANECNFGQPQTTPNNVLCAAPMP